MLRKSVLGGLMTALVMLAMPSTPVYAHERWFVEKVAHANEPFFISLTSSLLISGAVLFILLAFTVHRASWYRGLEVALDRVGRSLPVGIEWRVVAVLSGIMLVATSISGAFLAPELVLPHPGLVLLGSIGQMAIGLILLSQLSFFLAGLLTLVVAMPLAAIYFQGNFLMDYGFEYAALALALIFIGLSGTCPDKIAGRVRKWMQRGPHDFAHLPLPIIRIGLGLTFVTLGVHYKILNPNVTMTFLDEYNFNFMPYLGLAAFTNLHFVFAAGIAEITLGLLLVSGIATRFVAGVVLMFLSTTLILLGPVELIGHLPVIGVVLLLVYRGSGGYNLALPKVADVSYAYLSETGA